MCDHGATGDAAGGEEFGRVQHILAALDFLRKFGVERHRLVDFDNIGEGNFGIWAVGQFLDEFEQALVLGIAREVDEETLRGELPARMASGRKA